MGYSPWGHKESDTTERLHFLSLSLCSSMAQWVKNLPERQETQEMWVQSLGGKDPLEKEMATHSRVRA